MTNYSMQKGAVYNKRIKIVKKVLCIIAVIAVAFIWIRASENYNKKLMKISYCWDSNG